METVEIRWLKSILNVAERAKKGKNRYISGFRACSGRRSRRFKSCHLDKKPRHPKGCFGFFVFKKDLNLKKARIEKKTIINRFPMSGAKTGTADFFCGRQAEQIAKQDVSCHLDKIKNRIIAEKVSSYAVFLLFASCIRRDKKGQKSTKIAVKLQSKTRGGMTAPFHLKNHSVKEYFSLCLIVLTFS